MKSKNYKNYKRGLFFWGILMLLSIIATFYSKNLMGVLIVMSTSFITGTCAIRLFFDDYFWQAEQFREVMKEHPELKKETRCI